MRKWFGTVCMVLGVICLLGAIGFVVYNRMESGNAEQAAQSMLEEVQYMIRKDKINLPTLEESDEPEAQEDPAPDESQEPIEMATVKVSGYDCIGILSIPVLGLELPVLTDWSYAKLKLAPCHYYGSYYEPDFVIAAHNYVSHFGRLSELQSGDLVVFTDANGDAHYYAVVLLETLQKEATREMITSGFDLSLYTCTPGGGSRVTVRCTAIKTK